MTSHMGSLDFSISPTQYNLSLLLLLKISFKMSKFKVKPLQFEPTYPEGEEPLSSESEEKE